MGLVLTDGTIVEVQNICADPENGFEVRGEDLDAYEARTYATWHTHPGKSCNLSTGDYQSFLHYPEWDHFIVGTDGVARFFVENGKVLRCDAE